MNRPHFILLLEIELAMSAVPFERADLLAWVKDMWPWIAEDPDVRRWAYEFAAAHRVEQPA
jgi:hypothetical protein